VIENISFTFDALKEYMDWQHEDKKTLDKINKLIRDIIRNGNEGIGHPEPLRHDFTGRWSRRINDKNRLTYKIYDNGNIEIFNCKGHYHDR
jgi:toxin YoeB